MRLDRASEGLVRQMSRRNGGRLRSAAKRSRMFMTGASCLRPGHGGVDIRCVRVWCRLHNATPAWWRAWKRRWNRGGDPYRSSSSAEPERSEEHTSELQSLMRISYAVFCLKKKKHKITHQNT